MLNTTEVEYVTDCYVDIYKQIGADMQYVPLDRVNTVKDKSGKLQLVFLEQSKFTLNGLFVADKVLDADIAADAKTSRENGTVKFLIKQVTDKGFTPQEKDAIDIKNIAGGYIRYIISGFDDHVEIPYVFAKAIVTKSVW
jgi:hypothetical protein